MDSQPRTISELIIKSATANPLAPAIVAEGRAPLTYGNLLREFEHAVRSLNAFGLNPNDRVAIVARSGPEMVMLFLAVSATATCAPLNPSYTPAEFEFYLSDLAPRLLIVEAELPTQAVQVAARLGISTLQVVPAAHAAGAFSFVNGPSSVGSDRTSSVDHIGLVLHTSGTTGRPKIVPLSNQNLCMSAFNVARSLALNGNDRCLTVMPLFHIHGLIGAVLSTIASAGSLACPGAFRSAAFADWIKAFGPSWYTAAPSLHAAVFARARHVKEALRTSKPMRFLRSCSAPLPPQLITGLEELFSAPVLEAYGMTEATHQIACNPLPPNPRKPGSVGIATGTDVRIMDRAGNFLPRDVDGEIVVCGSSVMDGYAAAPEVNMAAFTNGWFRTGDQGRIDEDGYIFITGRIKEIINRGGEKVAPREIDEIFLSHPAVADAVAFAIPDPRLGEDIGAAVVLKASAEKIDARSLLAFAETRLAPFKLPRRILVVPEIPKGPTGKPQRIGLAKRLGIEDDAQPHIAPGASAASSTPTEQTLLRLCRETFELDDICLHDDFFDRGGDSLSAMRLLCEVERHWNVILTLADMLGAPTISSFAKLIDSIETRREPQIAAVQAGGSKFPLFSVAAGPGFRELARLLGPDQPFLGTLHPSAAQLSKPCRIEDVASYHVQVIRNRQPHGPYFIAGWCVDGLIAYEIAQQLRASGEPVALLVLFDTSFYFSDLEMFSQTAQLQARFVTERCERLLHTLLKPAQWQKIPDFVLRNWSGAARKRGASPEILREAAGWREVADILAVAAAHYRPSSYDGKVLLLNRSREQSRWKTRTKRDWSQLLKVPFEIYDIPCGHVEMFEKPYVEITAERVGNALRQMQHNGTFSIAPILEAHRHSQ